MWSKLARPWQKAFTLAWDAFVRGNVPVGSVIVDPEGQVVAEGQNAIFEDSSTGLLAGTNLAHAEMMALSGLKRGEHLGIGEYTLYSTLEPCPMCFGAIVMTGIKNVRFAARDGLAGSMGLRKATPYLRSKAISSERGAANLEALQIALSTAFELKRRHRRQEEILSLFKVDCPSGVEVGTLLYNEGWFAQAIAEGVGVDEVYQEVMERLGGEN